MNGNLDVYFSLEISCLHLFMLHLHYCWFMSVLPCTKNPNHMKLCVNICFKISPNPHTRNSSKQEHFFQQKDKTTVSSVRLTHIVHFISDHFSCSKLSFISLLLSKWCQYCSVHCCWIISSLFFLFLMYSSCHYHLLHEEGWVIKNWSFRPCFFRTPLLINPKDIKECHRSGWVYKSISKALNNLMSTTPG